MNENTTNRSDVRSNLARTENLSADRCTSEYTLKRTFTATLVKGLTLRCSRPATGHRVHQSSSIQW